MEEKYVYIVNEDYNGIARLNKAKLIKETAKMVVIEHPDLENRYAFGYRTHIPKNEVYFSPLDAAKARVTFLKAREEAAQQRYQGFIKSRKSAEKMVREYSS